MTQPYSSLLRGIVGCWSPAVKGSGGLRLPDLCRGNHGSFSNITVNDWQSSQNGWSINCNTSYNAVINCGSQPQGVFTQPFTMLAWVYNLTASPDCAPMAIDGGNNFIMPWISGGVVNAYWASGIRLSGVTSVVSKLRWQLLAISWTGDTAVIFIDNKIDGSGTVTTAPNVTTGTMVLGTYTTGATPRSMAGLLGECATFSRSMSLAEISEIYRLGNGGLGRLISSGNRKKALSIKPAYKPAKPRNYGVARVKETDYATLRQGLVGAWCPSLPSGGGGNTVPDVSGYNNHGTLTNMGPEDWVSGQYGRALDFDGVNDYVLTSNAILSGTGDFTVTNFFKINTTSRFHTFQGNFTASNSTGIQFGIFNTNKLFAYVASGGSFVAGTTLNANQWYSASVVRQNGVITIYLNGAPDGSATRAGAIGTSSNWRLGQGDTGEELTAQLDDARVYNRALTEPEIKLLASRPGIGLRQESHRQTFYQFPSGSRRRRILTGMP